jgi:spore maturation protein CgeB
MRIHHAQNQKPGSAAELELFVARSGVLSARINRKGALFYLHSAVAPEKEADHYAGMEFWGDLIVFLGTGLGFHFAPFLPDLPPGKKVLLVDYFPRCIEHCRKTHFAALPNSLEAVSSITPDGERRVGEFSVDAHYIQVIRHPASFNAHRDFYEQILDQIRFKRTRKTEAGAPMLFFGGFFLEEELRRALTHRYGRTALFRYGDDDAMRFASRLSRSIQEERPRYLLSVNLKGFDACGAVADVSRRLGVPVITWFVDDPHPILLSQRQFVNNHLFAFSWERSFIPWLSRQGFGAAAHLPLAGDPSLFSPAGASQPSTELGFVGSAMGRSFLEDLASRFLWNKTLGPIVVEAAKRLLQEKGKPLPELVRESRTALKTVLPFSDDRNLTWFSSYIIHAASMARRRELARASLPLGLETFGDPEGWKELLGEGVPVHGDIDYHTALPEVYRSIAINLNITSCQMSTAVNQRVFDIPLCNGFVLTDNQADLFELFAPDEIAVYSTADELVEKISHFKKHPDERAAIAKKARAAVLANHTYGHRLAALEKILD